MSKHNCTNPPHFPPHCGCPAEYAEMIEQEMIGKVTMIDGVFYDRRAEVSLMWHEGDPVAVSMLIEDSHSDTCWEFALDLLNDAFSKGIAGDGDITVLDLGKNVGFSLKTDEHHCTLVIPAAPTQKFLSKVYENYDAEDAQRVIEADLDDELELILSGA